jgi:transposase
MAKGFRGVDRDQLMLLPVDMREWLPADHLAWYVIAVVEQLDLSQLEVKYPLGGVGRQAYDPAMMTALLVYAYCQGIRSSRQIERLCLTDVGFRVISAQQRPDHSTITRFRVVHGEALAGLLFQVLRLCQAEGMVKVGVVSLDGSKISGRASGLKNYSESYLRGLAAELIAEAEQIDLEEQDENDDELPPGLGPGPDRAWRLKTRIEALNNDESRGGKGKLRVERWRRKRMIQEKLSRVDASLKVIRERETQLINTDVARLSKQLHAAEGSLATKRARVMALRSGTRKERKPVDQTTRVAEAIIRVNTLQQKLSDALAKKGPAVKSKTLITANLTDPETRRMPQIGDRARVQGFNAQIMVSDDYLILATDVTQDSTDYAMFTPMMRVLTTTLEALNPETDPNKTTTILADAGYLSEANLAQPGPDRLIALGKTPHERATPIHQPLTQAMGERLKPGTKDRKTYSRRTATVEPVFAHIKHQIGLTQFSRTGLTPAKHELGFAAAVHNIRRLAATLGYRLNPA